MPFDPESAFPSLLGLAAAYRDGATTPSAVVGAHLNRTADRDGFIGAFQTVYADAALLAAEAADRLIQTGYALGPFHGIPFVLKDICDLEGRVTTGGSKAMADRISPMTGTLAQRLIAAGGILLGKTKTVECAFGGWGTNQHMGTPRNPWDAKLHRVPGGSSSGTGASIAAGLAVCGVGTDTGGSVRLPASFCGLVGLKVTEGRLPTDGILPLSQSLDTPGPMARSVADVLLMYRVMDGVSGASITREAQDASGMFRGLKTGVRGLRLAVLDDAEREGCEADVLSDYDAALAVLLELGAELVTFAPSEGFAALTEACGRLITAEAYANHGALFEQAHLPLDDAVRARMLVGRDISASDYLNMRADRARAQHDFLAEFAAVDALVTPTAQMTAPAVAEVDQAIAPSHFTRLANYFGLCALALPMGLSRNGLPTSLQITAPPHAEDMALRIGAAYESARPPMPYTSLL